jgi:hypothetical protein
MVAMLYGTSSTIKIEKKAKPDVVSEPVELV